VVVAMRLKIWEGDNEKWLDVDGFSFTKCWLIANLWIFLGILAITLMLYGIAFIVVVA